MVQNFKVLLYKIQDSWVIIVAMLNSTVVMAYIGGTISVISGHAHEIQQRKGFEPLAHPWLGRQDSAADRRIAACQSVKGRAATVVVGSNGENMLK